MITQEAWDARISALPPFAREVANIDLDQGVSVFTKAGHARYGHVQATPAPEILTLLEPNGLITVIDICEISAFTLDPTETPKD